MSAKLDQAGSRALIRLVISVAFLVVVGLLGWESWTWVWRMSALFTLYKVTDVFYDRWRAGSSKAAVALRARAEGRTFRRAAR
jgi:hypothetical protein